MSKIKNAIAWLRQIEDEDGNLIMWKVRLQAALFTAVAVAVLLPLFALLPPVKP